MSSLMLCSDEDLDTIFYHLDFAAQCKFRRCGRRWNSLLRSATVLRTVVFTLSPDHDRKFTEQITNALQPAFPHLVNCVLIAYEPIDRFPVIGMWAVLNQMPTDEEHERRLYLCNFEASLGFLQAMYIFTAFNWIILNNITLPGDWIKYTLIDMLIRERDGSLDPDDHCQPLRQCDPIGEAGLTVQLTGSHILKSPLDLIGQDTTGKKDIVMGKLSNAALFRLITKNMIHLTQGETSDMLERLSRYDGVAVQADFVWLLKVYEPNLIQSTDLSWRTFDYHGCSPLIGRLLACYDRTVFVPDEED